MRNFVCYRNGPSYYFLPWLLQLINPFNWKSIRWSWVKWSIRQNLPRKFKYPRQEFDYFMSKFKNRIHWFADYNFKKV